VVLYVPTQDGKKIEVGMEIHVAPATVKPEEYGYLVGRVARVADFPATTRSMLHVLKNDQLARQLAATGAPFEVVAVLTPDDRTPSGFQWTSGNGPPVRIHSGTPAAARITVRTQRPLDLVVPALRKTLSL
jgi:HlyD family secretion protein